MSLFQSTSIFVRKFCGQDIFCLLYFYIFFFILSCFHFVCFLFFVVVALGLVCSLHCGLGQCLADTFIILRRKVVSTMCEKCLLYSFKKFQAEYKTLYINLSISTCSEGVLFVCWVPDSDREFDCWFSQWET